ncbi:tRNA (adenosine(37)-N6)-threonylcarbamoyltransferase complex dimerization subunit type 1 TsaB [Thalassotalea sp. G2M2-11]|uniref:tRNA (adenosine(37)-N6)-threonylcarbamoyltransferase complex dimerization subunit type 1 TsaB n=1 Tax=Thalassotalea sp. G2M2-11 TaxID=2787627 RepID=UPI0019D0C879|nr:tRNA (adenosine(37)-N6)-threonylcarbamoyltransferase complex dimerization subunit type 1 TsaB [Thalassotalea sp. G2M2-11]
MANYIAIDASTEACSVALLVDKQVFHEFELCPQSHSLVLLPMIDRLLKQAGCQLSELDGLIFGQGPGSFTGVRIGIGVAQGLAFSAELPVVGVSTLQAMAQLAYEKFQQSKVVSLIDARMSEVYLGGYQVNEQGLMMPVLDEAVLSPKKVAEYLTAFNDGIYGVGTGWDAYASELTVKKLNLDSPQVLYPDAKAMLTLGQFAFAQGKSVNAENAQPVYVRDTVSWKKLPGRE